MSTWYSTQSYCDHSGTTALSDSMAASTFGILHLVWHSPHGPETVLHLGSHGFFATLHGEHGLAVAAQGLALAAQGLPQGLSPHFPLPAIALGRKATITATTDVYTRPRIPADPFCTHRCQFARAPFKRPIFLSDDLIPEELLKSNWCSQKSKLNRTAYFTIKAQQYT